MALRATTGALEVSLGISGVTVHNTSTGKTVLIDMAGLLYDDGTLRVAAGSTGVRVSGATLTAVINDAGIKVTEISTGNLVVLDADGITVYNNSNGKQLTMYFDAINHDMQIETISVCVSGVSGPVTKSMDIIASTPY